MKRIISLMLALALLFSFTACVGNFSQVDLKEPIAIPENGIIEKGVLDKIKSENAIATFTGESNGIKYEWTVFGSDLDNTRDINLSVALAKTDSGLKVKLSETDSFGFPVLLSVHLNEKWKANNATAFDGDTAVYSVSVTGSKTSILNISVNKAVTEFEILPDDIQQDEVTAVDDTAQNKDTTQSDGKTDKNNKADDYLSEVTASDDRIYSDGKDKEKDKYETDPIPEGKPMPVEPEEQEVDKKKE